MIYYLPSYNDCIINSVMTVDEKLLRLVRRRVQKQSMHTVNGFVLHPREPSLYKWNCSLHIGQRDCFNGLAEEG